MDRGTDNTGPDDGTLKNSEAEEPSAQDVNQSLVVRNNRIMRDQPNGSVSMGDLTETLIVHQDEDGTEVNVDSFIQEETNEETKANTNSELNKTEEE